MEQVSNLKRPWPRMALALEFDRVEMRAAVVALTSKADGSIAGTAVVCFDARYAAIQWHGATRLDRRHAPAAQWRQFGLLLATLAPGADVPAELADWLREGRGVSLHCTAVHQISTAPTAITAALDGLLSPLNDFAEGR